MYPYYKPPLIAVKQRYFLIINEMFLQFLGEAIPPSTSRRFHPKKKDIRNHMYIAATKLRLSKLDQENLALKVEEWKTQNPNDMIYYRGYGEVVKESVEKTVVEFDDEENVTEIKVRKRFLNIFV